MESVQSEVNADQVNLSSAAPKQYALRSIFNDSGFHIGFAEASAEQPQASTDTFTMPQSLCYTNIDMAISHLESVLVHARSVQLAAAYNAGVAAAQEAAAEGDAPSRVTDVTAKEQA